MRLNDPAGPFTSILQAGNRRENRNTAYDCFSPSPDQAGLGKFSSFQIPGMLISAQINLKAARLIGSQF